MASRSELNLLNSGAGLVRLEVYGGLGAAIELSCKTDFCARSRFFVQLSQEILKALIVHQPNPEDGSIVSGVDEVRKLLENNSAVLKEDLEVRSYKIFGSTKKLAHYNHHNNKISAAVEYEGEDESVARRLAMQVAATRPLSIYGLESRARLWLPLSSARNKWAEDLSPGADDSAGGGASPSTVGSALADQIYIGTDNTKVSEVLSKHDIKVTNFLWISQSN